MASNSFINKILHQCILILLSNFIVAQNIQNENIQNPYIVTKINENIIFDGIPDEPFWNSIDSFPLVMFTPILGNNPSEASNIKIAYDDEYFYVSAWLYYNDAKNIRAIGKKRDYSSISTDFLGLILDTFNDKENGVSFFTNPNGLRTDGTIKNDAAVWHEDISFSWNTFWDVKTVVKDNVWSVEYRIPFSSLRFQTDNGKTIMGLLLMRYSAAKSEISTWPVMSPNFSVPYWKPSLCSAIEFEGLKPQKPIYVTPYATAGFNQVNELNEGGTSYELSTTPKIDAGLDIKYSFTNNLTTDITINTDFAQVEADDQKINLTRYSLYFPEKRIFFLEKSDVFDFSFLDGNNLFYSRRIGLYQGNPIRIYGGIRETGRIGRWDVGFLNMQTEAFENNPSENFGVLRVKRNVLNANSFVGGMFTSRLGMNGEYNIAYGIDGKLRVVGDEYLILKWAQTFENDSVNSLNDLNPVSLLVQWQRRNEIGFGYDLAYNWSGKRYNPGIGFEVKQNYHGPRIILQYGWLPVDHQFIRYHKLSLKGISFNNTATNLHETSSGKLQWNFEAKKGFSGNIAINWFFENLQNELVFGNDNEAILPGKYSFTYISAGYYTSGSSAFWAGLYTEVGEYFDGWKISVFTNPQFKIGASFDIGVTYRFDYINCMSRDMYFKNHIVGFKGLMTLTTKTSLTAFIQYNTAVEKIISNIRFRYNPREGNDFYFVYDEGLNTIRNNDIPNLPFSSGRTILLKYTYTFRW